MRHTSVSVRLLIVTVILLGSWQLAHQAEASKQRPKSSTQRRRSREFVQLQIGWSKPGPGYGRNSFLFCMSERTKSGKKRPNGPKQKYVTLPETITVQWPNGEETRETIDTIVGERTFGNQVQGARATETTKEYFSIPGIQIENRGLARFQPLTESNLRVLRSDLLKDGRF